MSSTTSLLASTNDTSSVEHTSLARAAIPPIAMMYSSEYYGQLSKHTSHGDRDRLFLQLFHAYGLHRCSRIHLVAPRPCERKSLLSYHTEEYVRILETYTPNLEASHVLDTQTKEKLDDYGLIDDCPFFPGLYTYTKYVAGASLQAAKLLETGTYRVVINWGGGRHHALAHSANGFCYVNDINIAILHLLQAKQPPPQAAAAPAAALDSMEHKSEEEGATPTKEAYSSRKKDTEEREIYTFPRILYIDLDIHHGDAIQECFYQTERVFTLSFHHLKTGFFPGTGSLSSVGESRGRFSCLNIPLKEGICDIMFMKLFQTVFNTVMNMNKPSFIVLQCGVDGLATDRMSRWNLTSHAMGRCVNLILQHKLPTLILGGGGYTPTSVARAWVLFTSIAAKITLKSEIPEHAQLPRYAPHYELFTRSIPTIQDKNTSDFIKKLLDKIRIFIHGAKQNKKPQLIAALNKSVVVKQQIKKKNKQQKQSDDAPDDDDDDDDESKKKPVLSQSAIVLENDNKKMSSDVAPLLPLAATGGAASSLKRAQCDDDALNTKMSNIGEKRLKYSSQEEQPPQ